MSQVISIRSAPAGWEHDPMYVYVGRAGHGQRGYFGNPFPLLSEAQRDEVYDRYVAYLKDRVRHDPEFAQAVRSLAGKTLVCFCAPLRCHAQALSIMAEHLAQA